MNKRTQHELNSKVKLSNKRRLTSYFRRKIVIWQNLPVYAVHEVLGCFEDTKPVAQDCYRTEILNNLEKNKTTVLQSLRILT